jgi:hypothetical protein
MGDDWNSVRNGVFEGRPRAPLSDCQESVGSTAETRGRFQIRNWAGLVSTRHLTRTAIERRRMPGVIVRI